MRLTVAVVMIIVLVVLMFFISKRNTYAEISSAKNPSYSVAVGEDGVPSLTVWEATWYFPTNQETIRVWDEIDKDVGWFTLRSWRNDDHVFMNTTDLVRKTVCSCTPVRSI